MTEIQGLSGLFRTKLEDFGLRWEQALFLTSDPPSDKALEGLYVSKLQDSSRNSARRRKNKINTD